MSGTAPCQLRYFQVGVIVLVEQMSRSVQLSSAVMGVGGRRIWACLETSVVVCLFKNDLNRNNISYCLFPGSA